MKIPFMFEGATESSSQSTTSTTSTAAVSPPGAVAEWYFEEGVGNGASNKLSPNGAPTNLFTLSSGPFQSHPWGNRSAVTDDYCDGPFAGTRAARFNASGSTFAQQVYLPKDGYYTISIYVKSNTGLAQTMRLALGSDYGSDIAVPATGWTLVQRTITGSAGSCDACPVVTNSANGALDVVFWGPSLVYGLKAITSTPADGTLVLGGTPLWDASGVVLGSGKYAVANLQKASTLYGFSLYSVLKWPTAAANNPPDSDHVAVVGEATPSPTFYLTARNSPSKLGFTIGPVSVSPKLSNEIRDDSWHLVGGIFDGERTRLYLDDVEVGFSESTFPYPVTLDTVSVGAIQKDSWALPGTFAYTGVFNVGHTSAQVFKQFDRLKSYLSSRGVSIKSPNIVFFEGDSISADQNHSPDTYPFLVTPPTGTLAVNRAISGSSTVDLNNRAARLDNNVRSSRKNALFVLIGYNDMNSGCTAEDTFARLKAYCIARRAAGWNKIIVSTLTPATSPGFSAKRATYNALIKADSSFYDVLCDFASEATIGPDSAAANTAYFLDGVHLTQAGHNLLLPIAQGAITKALE